MTKLLNWILQLSKNEWVLLLLTVSIFISVYLEILLLVLLPIYIFATRQFFIFRARKKDLIFLSAFWILSMIVTICYGSILGILLGVAMIFVFIAMLFIAYSMTKRMFRLIISLCCFASIPCFLVAMIQMFTGFEGPYGARYCSVFQNPNYYAAYLTFVILFCIYCAFKAKGKMKFVYLALIIPNIVGLYLTECRTAIAVVIIAAGILIGAKSKKYMWIYYGVIAAIVLFYVLFYDTFPFIPRTDEIFKDLLKRMDIWKGAIKSIVDTPLFGKGYYAYSLVSQEFGSAAVPHSHNLLLELLMDFGVVGTVILLAYLAINVAKIIKLHKKNICHYRYSLTIAMIVTVLLHGMLDLTALYPQTSLIIMFVISFSTEYDKYHIFKLTEQPDLGYGDTGISFSLLQRGVFSVFGEEKAHLNEPQE